MKHLHKLNEYRDALSGFGSVPGWFWRLDLDLFEHILAAQLEPISSVPGDLLEIGSYHGKSAIAIAYGLREGERFTVCDVFGQQYDDVAAEGMDAYEGLSLEVFQKRFKQWHKDTDSGPVLDIFGGPSQCLCLNADRPIRFAHIDGGHAFETVSDDILMVVPHMHPYGVVVLDDFQSTHTPGVAAAAWCATMEERIYPFLLSGAKMYAAVSKPAFSLWRDVCEEIELPHEIHQIAGDDVRRVWQ